jgi:hypothetical protein
MSHIAGVVRSPLRMRNRSARFRCRRRTPVPGGPANRPGGHDRRSTRPAAWLALPARDSFPAELAVAIQDGTAFVIASPNPTRTAASEPADRAGRENTQRHGSPAFKRSARLNAWASGYGDGPGEGWRTAPARISSEVLVWQIIAFRISVPGWSAHTDGLGAARECFRSVSRISRQVECGGARYPWRGSAPITELSSASIKAW